MPAIETVSHDVTSIRGDCCGLWICVLWKTQSCSSLAGRGMNFVKPFAGWQFFNFSYSRLLNSWLSQPSGTLRTLHVSQTSGIAPL